MAKYKFTNEDNKEWVLIPAGEYRYEIVGVDCGIISGGKAAGADYAELKLAIYGDAAFSDRLAILRDALILNAKCAWRADTFVKSSNLLVRGEPPQLGDDIEFDLPTLEGLRGWCHVGVRKYQRKDGTYGEANEVRTWITNKEKLPRAPRQVANEWEDV